MVQNDEKVAVHGRDKPEVDELSRDPQPCGGGHDKWYGGEYGRWYGELYGGRYGGCHGGRYEKMV